MAIQFPLSVESYANTPVVKGVLEGARRKLARSVHPKEPLSYDVVADITRSLSTESPSIADIRFLFILFAGYARCSSYQVEGYYDFQSFHVDFSG